MTSLLKVAANGAEISYEVSGPEGAPWLTLSNSLATDRTMWAPQMNALEQTHRVLRYDTRGHGQSSAEASPYTFDLVCEDVIALLDHLSIEKTDFLGLSFGGMTALAMGIRHPNRINKLICCDARAFAPPPYTNMWVTNIARMHEQGLAPIAEETIGRWFTEGFRAKSENAQLLATMTENFMKTSHNGYEGVASCLSTLDLLKDLPKITATTRFIVGSSDPAAPIDAMQEMSDKVAGSDLVVIENAAHISNMEQPEAFTAAVCEFLLS
ncbi:MAG: alpha/beta fold hydrolase [Sneathiella sp.]